MAVERVAQAVGVRGPHTARSDDDEELRPALELLRRRHLVLLASLRETGVERSPSAPFDDFETTVRHAAALDYAQARRGTLERLRMSGVLTLDVALAETYLDVKRDERL